MRSDLTRGLLVALIMAIAMLGVANTASACTVWSDLWWIIQNPYLLWGIYNPTTLAC